MCRKVSENIAIGNSFSFQKCSKMCPCLMVAERISLELKPVFLNGTHQSFMQ